VDYSDEQGSIRVDAEYMLKPFRIAVYVRSGDLRTMEGDRVEKIVGNVVRALEFMGHQVERW
jgi:hypothetical protein